VCRTGNTLPKGPGEPLVVVLRPDNGLVVSDKAPREFVVAIFALVGEPFLQSRRELLSPPTLRLPKAVSRLPQFVGMINVLASREGQERMEARVNAYRGIARVGNSLRLGVDE